MSFNHTGDRKVRRLRIKHGLTVVQTIRRWLVLVGLIFITTSSILWSQNPDSLRTLFWSAPDLDTRVQAALDIGTVFFQSDRDSVWAYWSAANHLVEQALEQNPSDSIHLRPLLGETLMHLGFFIHRKEWNASRALATYEHALTLLGKNGHQNPRATTLNNMANIFDDQGDYQSALELYQSAMDLFREIDFSAGIAISLDDIGLMHTRLGDLANAELCLNQALAMASSIEATAQIAIAEMHLAYLRTLQSRYPEAETHLESARAQLTKGGDTYLQSLHYRYRGIFLTRLGKFKEAKSSYVSSLHLAESIDYQKGQAYAYQHLSKLAELQGDSDEVIHYARACLAVANRIGLIRMIQDITDRLSRWHEANGQPYEALRYLRQSQMIKDSLLDLDKQRSLLRQQMQYEFSLQNHQQSALLQQKTWVNRLSLAAGFILLLLCLAFIHRIRYVRRVNRDIAIQKGRAEESERMKDVFYTNITHEFRTPLTVILGLADHLGGQAPNSLREDALMIRRNADQLLNLINQMLELARLEGGHRDLHLIRGDILPYLKSLTDSQRPLARRKQQELQTDIPNGPLIMAYDPEKVQRIFTNLLGNAIKYTPPGGVIKVMANVLPSGEKRLRMEFRDNGPGIPPEAVDRIFERFYQVNQPGQTEAGGTGIGLALTKTLVTILGGCITVDSMPGIGSTFIVELPILPPSDEHQPVLSFPITDHRSPSPLPVPPGLPALTHPDPMVPSGIPDTSPLLLLLEDHPDIGRYVTRLLQKKYRVVLATEGAYGLRLAMDLLPDLVICDIMMPGMDGLQVCRALKEDIRTEHIPILILSAKAGVEDRIQGLGLEVDGYMAKPFHPEELVSRIDALIRIRSRLRNRYANGQPSDLLQHDPDPVHDSFLVRLHEYFSRHADNPDLTVEEISRHFHLSRMQLHRKVKELTGDSTSIYLRKFRLRSARQLLQDSRMTISEVAYRVGYNNPKHFSRQYDEMFGSRPSDRRS